jgi:hypothetical protein
MAKGPRFRTVGAAIAVSAALAACGGGGGAKTPSALDPANMVPANSVVYLSAAIRPQGSTKRNLSEAIDSIAGKGSASRLYAKFKKSSGRQWSELEAWAGQRAGVALTAVPSKLGGHQLTDDAVFVIPTNDPSAARKFLAKNVRQSFESWKVVGHYAIFGGTVAVARALATTPKTSLAADAGFKSDVAELGSGDLFTAYARLHQLYQELLPLLKSNPAYSASTLSGAAKQAPPGSSVAFGMAALHNQFRVDFINHGAPTSNPPASLIPTEVSSLPGSSWLAIALGGALAKGSTVSALTAQLSKELGTIQALSGKVGGHVPNGPLSFVEQDLLPALGPAELSVSGSSSTTLQAGLVIAPANRSAGPRLVRAIKRLVSGLPISASATRGRVAVTFGFSSLAQLLNPSSKLAGNPSFKHALAQLPAGAKAELYLNFGGIAALASLDPSAGSSSAMSVLHRLDYLIAGGTHSHFRLVLETY